MGANGSVTGTALDPVGQNGKLTGPPEDVLATVVTAVVAVVADDVAVVAAVVEVVADDVAEVAVVAFVVVVVVAAVASVLPLTVAVASLVAFGELALVTPLPAWEVVPTVPEAPPDPLALNTDVSNVQPAATASTRGTKATRPAMIQTYHERGPPLQRSCAPRKTRTFAHA